MRLVCDIWRFWDLFEVFCCCESCYCDLCKIDLCLLCLCARLFICALWPPAGKGLTSWLSFVVSNCEFVTFSLVSWVRCGTWLYRFLNFAPLLTLISILLQFIVSESGGGSEGLHVYAALCEPSLIDSAASCLYFCVIIGFVERNPVFGGLRTTQAQTSLRISAVWSTPLLFAFWKVSYVHLP